MGGACLPRVGLTMNIWQDKMGLLNGSIASQVLVTLITMYSSCIVVGSTMLSFLLVALIIKRNHSVNTQDMGTVILCPQLSSIMT